MYYLNIFRGKFSSYSRSEAKDRQLSLKAWLLIYLFNNKLLIFMLSHYICIWKLTYFSVAKKFHLSRRISSRETLAGSESCNVIAILKLFIYNTKLILLLCVNKMLLNTIFLLKAKHSKYFIFICWELLNSLFFSYFSPMDLADNK